HSFPTLRSSDLHRIDDSGDLMSRHPRVLDAGRGAFLCNGIGVTNTACFNLDAHRSNAGLRNFTLNELQCALGTSHLHNTHLRHTSSDASFIKRVSANFEAPATVVPGSLTGCWSAARIACPSFRNLVSSAAPTRADAGSKIVA